MDLLILFFLNSLWTDILIISWWVQHLSIVLKSMYIVLRTNPRKKDGRGAFFQKIILVTIELVQEEFSFV